MSIFKRLGTPWILVSVIMVSISMFFPFSEDGGGLTWGWGFLKATILQPDLYGMILSNFLSNIYNFVSYPFALPFYIGFLLLPMTIILGILSMLIGIRYRIFAMIGSIILMIVPISFLILLLIIFPLYGVDILVTLNYPYEGLYLQLIGAILGYYGSKVEKKKGTRLISVNSYTFQIEFNK